MKQQARDRVNAAIDDLVTTLADELKLAPQEIANVVFYRAQKHPIWGRNPTKKQKDDSYAFFEGICQRCREPVPRNIAVFHHTERGTAKQHDANRMVPYHRHCHDSEHNVSNGSFH